MKDPFLTAYKTETLTVAQSREHRALQEQTGRMWRNFWIRVFKEKGYSNVQIAKEMMLSESTVRAILKPKGK